VLSSILGEDKTRERDDGPATRCEKRAANFRVMVVIASIVMWLNA
jgi:hypothetical protein